jgi:hypothetical protein
VLTDAAVGEARTGAADMAPGAHPELEVAPRLVGAASLDLQVPISIPLCLRAEAGCFEGLTARA